MMIYITVYSLNMMLVHEYFLILLTYKYIHTHILYYKIFALKVNRHIFKSVKCSYCLAKILEKMNKIINNFMGMSFLYSYIISLWPISVFPIFYQFPKEIGKILSKKVFIICLIGGIILTYLTNLCYASIF